MRRGTASQISGRSLSELRSPNSSSSVDDTTVAAVALYDFDGTSSKRTLTIKALDKLRVEPREGKDWWAALNVRTGKEGYVPRLYVRVLEEDGNQDRQQRQPSANRAASAAATAGAAGASSAGAAPARSPSSNGTRNGDGTPPSAAESATAPLSAGTFVKAVAMFNFRKEHEDQMSFSKGQMLLVLAHEEEQWWPARTESDMGLVPANYIKVLHGDASVAAAASAAHSSEKENAKRAGPPSARRASKDSSSETAQSASSSASASAAAPAPSPSSAPAPAPSAAASAAPAPSQRAVGLFDFRASTDRELSFGQGDFLTVFPTEKPWWKASVIGGSGATGLVPNNYIRVLTEEEEALARHNDEAASAGPASPRGAAYEKAKSLSVRIRRMSSRIGSWQELSAWSRMSGNVDLHHASYFYGYTSLRQLPFFSILFERASKSDGTDYGFLDAECFRDIESKFTFKTFTDGEIVFTEGSVGKAFYIIVEGAVAVRKGTLDLAIMRQGQWFGEMALLEEISRTATVVSAGQCTLLTLTGANFRHLVGTYPALQRAMNRLTAHRTGKTLSSVPFFRKITLHQLDLLGSLFHFVQYKTGEVVCAEGERAQEFYIITRGEVAVTVLMADGTQNELARLGTGKFFGELSLLQSSPRTATVTAVSPLTLMLLNASKFSKFLDIVPELRHEFMKVANSRSAKTLAQVPFFADIPVAKLELLAGLFVYDYFEENQTIFNLGDPGKRFYVIKSGEVEARNKRGETLRVMRPNDFFGEVALVEHRPRTATVVCTRQCMCVSLSKSSFENFLAVGPEVKQLLLDAVSTRAHHGKKYRNWISNLPDELSGLSSLRRFDIDPDDLQKHPSVRQAFRSWDRIGRCMEPCLQILKGWPQYRVAGEALKTPKGKRVMIVSIVGLSDTLSLIKIPFKLEDSVGELVERLFSTFKRKHGEDIDEAGPQVFGFKVASRADYLCDRRAPLGRYKCLEDALKRGHINGELQLALIDLRIDPSQGTTGLRRSNSSVQVLLASGAIRSDSSRALQISKSGSRRRGDDMAGSMLGASGGEGGSGDGQTTDHDGIVWTEGPAAARTRAAVGGVADEDGVSAGEKVDSPTVAKRMAVAKFNFCGSDTSKAKLDFRKDDKMTIEWVKGADWWYGTLTQLNDTPVREGRTYGPRRKLGERGLVPSNYIKMLDEPRKRGDEEEGERRDAANLGKKKAAVQRSFDDADLPGSPTMSFHEWTAICEAANREAMHVRDEVATIDHDSMGHVSTADLAWPFRVKLRGLSKLKSLPRYGRYQRVKLRVELVFGGLSLHAKETHSLRISPSIRFDEDWFYFNRSIANVPFASRLCFTLIGEKLKNMTTTPSKKPKKGTAAADAALLAADVGPVKHVLGGASLQVYDCTAAMKTSLQRVYMWPDERGEMSVLCADNPAMNAPEILVEFDTFGATPYYKIPPAVVPPHDASSASGNVRSGRRSSAFNEASAGAPEHAIPADIKELLQRDPILAYNMTRQERAKLWRHRERLTGRADALAKVMLSVDWTSMSERDTALEILQRWKMPGPMQAMELLDRRFGDYRLREYAVGCLEGFSDDELAEFLLQLAQVLKYEPYHASALGNFLLRRGLQNPRKVGMKLFWTLRSEMHLVKYATRFGILLKAYLQSCGTHRGELTRQFDVQNLLKTVADSVVKVKGDKEERNAVGRLLLDKLNGQLPSEFQISLDARIKVKKIRVQKCRVMNSKKKPLFLCLENVDASEAGGKPYWMMFKSGDDLRQDQMTLQIIRIMDQIWLSNGMDLCMSPYACVSTGDELGMLEIVTPSMTTADIHKKYAGKYSGALRDNTIKDFLEDNNRGTMRKAIDKFVRSCAGYVVATYVMGIGDRHSDNIMIKTTGELFHIDFGHFLGHFKSKMGFKRERTPFVFTPEMAHVMGGKKGADYKVFVSAACKAYNILRRHGNELITLFRLMIPAGMPELTTDSEIQYMADMLRLDLTEEEAAKHFQGVIKICLNDRYRRYDNLIHNIKTG